MFLLRKVAPNPIERSELRDKLPSLPEAIIDSLVSRFTETIRGSTKWVLCICGPGPCSSPVCMKGPIDAAERDGALDAYVGSMSASRSFCYRL